MQIINSKEKMSDLIRFKVYIDRDGELMLKARLYGQSEKYIFTLLDMDETAKEWTENPVNLIKKTTEQIQKTGAAYGLDLKKEFFERAYLLTVYAGKPVESDFTDDLMTEKAYIYTDKKVALAEAKKAYSQIANNIDDYFIELIEFEWNKKPEIVYAKSC